MSHLLFELSVLQDCGSARLSYGDLFHCVARTGCSTTGGSALGGSRCSIVSRIPVVGHVCIQFIGGLWLWSWVLCFSCRFRLTGLLLVLWISLLRGS